MTTQQSPVPTTAESAWIRRYHPAVADAPRLICFPHAGGSASFYFPVAKELTPGIDVLVVQYPGRQERRREPLIDNVPELARLAFEELRHYADRPLYLFGHSMGATVAFEIARRFRDAGLPAPARLFASARRAPSRTRDDRVHTRDDEGVIRELRRLSGTDDRVLGNEEIMRLALPAIRNDYKAVETYRVDRGVSVDCPVTVLIGDTDPNTTLDEAHAWAGHTTADCEVQSFPGGHFYLADRQREVLDAITSRIAATATVRG
ncbi:thioesterase II family protein [Streptomyces sp. HUAS TT20]|uniref:thioesterase II family protein n=1 Tax=Streptomyces sp. HUAS TT20 TaxID=3447509 RepID=UPI0021D850B9|nr:alpha/beta fold hydrolase [Streptomyces sp. HUAS 15-9]UXY30528.1 alpha/beta fold hydrolase [Streptomyces sp. HUAS 15-9]